MGVQPATYLQRFCFRTSGGRKPTEASIMWKSAVSVLYQAQRGVTLGNNDQLNAN